MATTNRALKLAILDRETTQTDVAEKAGIHESRFSKIIRGRLEPNDDEKKAIAKALRKSVHDLFSEAVAS